MAVESQRADISAALVKLETTYGVDPTPTPAANGVLINSGAEITANADKETRNIVRETFSPAGSTIGAKSLDLAVEVEVRGGGMDADGITPLPPDYDPWLQCCGMQRRNAVRLTVADAGTFKAGETVTGGTSTATGVVEYVERDNVLVVIPTNGTFAAPETITGSASAATGNCTAVAHALLYQPITAVPSAQKSAATYFWSDAILHRLLGVRGSFSLDAQVGKVAKISFKLSGLWVDPADQGLPVPALTDLVGVQALNMGVRIGDYEPICTAIKFDLGTKVEKRYDANAAEGLVGLLITGREPTGSLDPEVDTLAHFNPWTAWKAGDKHRVSGTLGSVAGNRMAFHMGAGQVTDPKYASRVGLRNYNLTYTPCQVRLGDDELYLCYF